MYDKGKIITGLIIFFGLLSIPLWYTMANEKEGARETSILDSLEKVDRASKGDKCVLDVDEMRANHMDILNDWRDLVVREGIRTHKTEDRGSFKMSLTNGCLDCHKSKAKFCDLCHDYMGVKPYCWECHVIPEELEVNK